VGARHRILFEKRRDDGNFALPARSLGAKNFLLVGAQIRR